MPRHVEYSPYAVKPVTHRPGVGAKEAAAAGKPFEQLLADAESVQDAVRITAPAGAPGMKGIMSAGLLAAAATGLWHGVGLIGWQGRGRKAAVGDAGTESMER